MSIVLLYVGAVLLSCSASVSAIVDPLAIAKVSVAFDRTFLSVGHFARAFATPKDTAGNAIPGRAISWSSQNPAIATVSDSGNVTAVAPGVAVIRGTVAGVSGTDSVRVVSSPDSVSHNFDDGTLGVYTNPWTYDIDVVADPTGAGKGKVARIFYHPATGGSLERALTYTSLDKFRYGQTIWMRGDVFFASGTAGYNPNHNRKIIDYQGGGVRMTLHRRDMVLRFSAVDWMNGSEQEVMDPSTGITLLDNTWYTIEVRMTTNSADNVRDGILEIYINGALTPTYQRTTGLGWITEKFAGGSYFKTFMAGYQLTIDAASPVYTEYRYWDNLGFSATRLGK